MSLEPRVVEKRDPRIEAHRRMVTANDRYKVLGECLTLLEASRRRMSRNEAAQTAKEGYELAFEQENWRIEIIRQMMVEQRSISERAMREYAEAVTK